MEAHPAIPQGAFLECLGLEQRVKMMVQNSKGKGAEERLMGEYRRLVHPEEMGEIYKAQVISLKKYKNVFPFKYSEL